MPHFYLQLQIQDVLGRTDTFEIGARVEMPRNAVGERSLWEELALKFTKELVPEDFENALPDPLTISLPPHQTFSGSDLYPMRYFDRRNTYWTWFAIRQTLIQSRWHLTQARTYKAIEPVKGAGGEVSQVLANLHYDKMDSFHLGMQELAKVEDLFLRLIFESLGASLVKVNLAKPNWESSITRDRIRKGLRMHPSRISRLGWWPRMRHWLKSWRGDSRNRHLEELTNAEYEELMRIFNQFPEPNFVRVFTEYRNKLTHRLNPSVDYPELYIELEDRRGRESVNTLGQRVVVYNIGATRTTAEYTFETLFDATTQTMAHYIALLGDLQRIPRFFT